MAPSIRALVIGVNKYQDFADLTSAIRGAEEVRDVLKGEGADTKFLEDATKEEIVAAVKELSDLTRPLDPKVGNNQKVRVSISRTSMAPSHAIHPAKAIFVFFFGRWLRHAPGNRCLVQLPPPSNHGAPCDDCE